jgi:hypothetical protein
MKRSVCFALTLFAGISLAFPPSGGGSGHSGQGHGKNLEPATVLPLKAKLEHDLSVHDGIVDAVIGPAKPALWVRVVKLEPDSVVVEIRNLTTDTLKLSLYQVMQDGRYAPTSSCPIAPGVSSFESWPEAFDAIGFGAVKIVPKNAKAICE